MSASNIKETYAFLTEALTSYFPLVRNLSPVGNNNQAGYATVYRLAFQPF